MAASQQTVRKVVAAALAHALARHRRGAIVPVALGALGAIACATPIDSGAGQGRSPGFLFGADAGAVGATDALAGSDAAGAGQAGGDASDLLDSAGPLADAVAADGGPGDGTTPQGGCDADAICPLEACTAGTAKCVGNAVATCDATGASDAPATACPSQTTCVAVAGSASCQPWACTPGSGCQGAQLITCSADGMQATVIDDCASSGKVCVDGSCKAVICAPDATFCAGSVAMTCTADGTAAAVVETCAGAKVCVDGACVPQICTPLTPACVGDIATVCKSDGSGYELPGQACAAAGQLCVLGACKSPICKPSSPYCDGKEALFCADDGLSAAFLDLCDDAEICKDGVCIALVCPAGQQACKDGLAVGCNADGTAWLGAGQSCAAGGQVCFEGACINQTCGNGIVEGAEACDDGNTIQTDACLNTCKAASCGDGLVQAGVETCDDGNADEDDGCLSTCVKDCSDRAKKVYVVTEQKALLRFEVETLQLSLVGMLNCPGSGTPFSMSVDRDANAWVLYYGSGTKLYQVSTLDASCKSTAFSPNIGGFQVFGMGFSSNAPGSEDETLFVSGGSTFSFVSSAANLGKIAMPGLGLSSVGTIQMQGGPELTGTGDAELWGFFPYQSKIGLIDKNNGSVSKALAIPLSMSSVQAWAFAAYAGKFYLFFKSQSDPSSSVYELDPATGTFKQVLGNVGYTITGAGVSSCAPTKAK